MASRLQFTFNVSFSILVLPELYYTLQLRLHLASRRVFVSVQLALLNLLDCRQL